jgi:high-affinity iron transporter
LRVKTASAGVIAVLTLALTACGGDDGETTEVAEATVTPEAAIGEIALVRQGLDQALAQYREDDAAGAADTVDETYLQHFELVEGPLEEADAELNEELEEQIREELTSEIESGAAMSEVEALVTEIDSGLDEAKAALEAA